MLPKVDELWIQVMGPLNTEWGHSTKGVNTTMDLSELKSDFLQG